MARTMQKQEHWHVSGWQAQANSAGRNLLFVQFRCLQSRRHIHCLHPHRRQASQQKSRRKAFPVYLSVDLVGQFVYAEKLEPACQQLVSYPPLLHFLHKQRLGLLLPWGIRDLRALFDGVGSCRHWKIGGVPWDVLFPENWGQNPEFGRIRPKRHFSGINVPTRSRQQLLQVSDVG
jgi:hypothetical protein